jgi:hypothetical protein
MHIASLVVTVRPFINELYAALHDATRSGPTPQSIWAAQIRHSVDWLKALLTRRKGALTRSYDLSVYFGAGNTLDMCLDASPWGLGGFLTINGDIVSYFACSLSPAEVEILGIEVGQSSSQQIVEALATLVAMRAWCSMWVQERARIKVRRDSISALVLCLNLKTKGAGTTLIAREVALDIADALYAPHIVEHIPGLDNTVADMLSRRFAPGYTFALPPCLRNVEELVLPPRDVSYFVTRSNPSDLSVRPGGMKRGYASCGDA